MRRILLFLIIWILPLFSQDFTISIQWDEMEMSGNAEGVLQYYHQGKVEAIKGNHSKPSKDGNVTVVRTHAGGSQKFNVSSAKGKLFNIWIINDMMIDDFATEEDFMALANAKATALIEDRVNHQTYQVQVPANTPGFAFRAGAIVDGRFYNITEMFAQQRMYQVNMVDAVTGKLLPGVNVAVRNKRTGETVAMGKTDDHGFFMHRFDYGKYDVLFSKPGYMSSKHEFEMDLTELPVAMNFAMTPEVKEFRIVLTWGAYPRDLDAHLAGPKPEGGSFHLWYRNKVLVGGRNFLDRDDTRSYGPETMTIYKPARGVYTYAVQNYSGRNRSGSLDLAMSGAHVDVYANGKLQASFNVPRNKKGNVWQVFRIDENQRIVPLNQMYDESRSSAVIHY